VKLLRKGMSLPLIIRRIPLSMLAMWSVISGSAPDSPDQLLRVGLTLQVSLILTTTTQVPRPNCRGFFVRLTVGSICATSAHLKLPKFDHSRRELTLASTGAPAGLGPHIKQGLIAAEQFALRHLTGLRTWPLIVSHFQQLYQGRYVFVGCHG
jgi:hypothetical protein